MGHIHLGVLPATRKWREVVDLLDGHATAGEIAGASAVAAEQDLSRAADNPVFVECVRLLAMIPQAARSADFGSALRDLGIPAANNPGTLQIISATGIWLDQFARQQGNRTDFGELARRALLSTLMTNIEDGLPGLFDATPADVSHATASLSSSRAFSPYARDFFSRLLSDTLSFWLDRKLSTRVGHGRRFDNVGERAGFDTSLQQYCREATRIIAEFSSGWYGKTINREGRIDRLQATRFGAVAFKKITEELRRKRDAAA